jgi:hypothetical protein
MYEASLGIGFLVWQADGPIKDYARYRRNEAAAIVAGMQDAIDKAPRSFEGFSP